MVLGGVVGIAVALIIAIVAFFVPATSTLECPDFQSANVKRLNFDLEMTNLRGN